MRRLLLATLLALFVASPAFGQVVWNGAFEATPANGDLVSQGDDRIREFKVTASDALEVEHDIGPTGTDTGRQIEGSARGYVQAAEPATLPANDRLASNALDDGRIYIDEDDSQPFFRDQSIATDIANNYGAAAADWVSLWPRAWTTVSSGGVADEVPGAPTDDTRDTITGISAQSIIIPNDGRSYELRVKAVVKYQMDTAGHAGLWLEETAPGATDRDVAFITVVGAQENAGTVVLEYLLTNPVNGTTYTFDVDMASSTAASFFVNPTSAVINGGAGGIPYNVTGAISRLFLTVQPRYVVGDY